MGMSDRQFDVMQKKTLRELESVRQEIEAKYGGTSEKLEVMIKDIEEQLKRP